MSAHYYQLCCDNIGAAVEITTYDGIVHRGIIDRVNRERVYLRQLEASGGGYGAFIWGPGWVFGAGILLGSIATLAFLPFYWW